jgi:molybdopterin-binding protein
MHPAGVPRGMELSARNQLTGTIKSVKKDEIMAEIVVELGDGQTVTSTITRGSADRLELGEGDEVEAVIKASEVMVQKD